ncbi:calcium-binding protein [Ruegeria profundi]|uniref:calcium-binding protein n=1 Tax=Ruegeria profundi TaxID=1685378 RepID=UPI001CD33671|nr:calcium-binding protein [Ruegeria profundi]MCA0929516.1 calcium-binding protein [Ruegeria profundi]
MFLFGLLSLAAVGGAAIALSDAFVSDDEPEEDDSIDDQPDAISEGKFIEFDTPEEDTLEPAEQTEPEEQTEAEDSSTGTPPTGTIVSEYQGDLVISGTSDADILTGQYGNDQINGFDGDDVIHGCDGNDVLHGGAGLDIILGGEGDDILHGEDGGDLITGNEGEDTLYGHFGADQMEGGAGDDTLYGGQDDDTLLGGDGGDALHGGFGDDILDGGAGEDVLFGGDGNDVLTGEDPDGEHAPDFLNGGAGEDTFLADSGDIVTGGDGADDIILDPDTEDEAVTVMDFQPGQDKLFVSWDGQDDPEIQIETDAENENLVHVLVEGQGVAQLLGAEGLTADDIQLISGAELAHLTALS